MSIELDYTPATFDLGQLHDELLRASLTPELVTILEDGTTVHLVFPDETVEADVDAVVAAHVPRVRYDSAAKLAEAASLREAALLRAELLESQRAVEAAVDLAALKTATGGLIEVLMRRDRAAGMY